MRHFPFYLYDKDGFPSVELAKDAKSQKTELAVRYRGTERKVFLDESVWDKISALEERVFEEDDAIAVTLDTQTSRYRKKYLGCHEGDHFLEAYENGKIFQKRNDLCSLTSQWGLYEYEKTLMMLALMSLPECKSSDKSPENLYGALQDCAKSFAPKSSTWEKADKQKWEETDRLLDKLGRPWGP